MKKVLYCTLILILFTPVFLFSQEETDSTGFAGDHFSLEGALEMFKQSASPEEFEKKLNTEDSYVNNLDLNEDGEIDYIKVIDNLEKEVHAIVLQVDVNAEETQDIAVILIEKTGAESAILQIIGDEDVYGEETIVEPFAEDVDSGGKGGYLPSFSAVRVTVNVWAWPSVRFIYAPAYRPYVSPWRWRYYPSWYTPWRPHPWRWHYSHRTVYHVHYKPFATHRVVKAHSFYKPKRKSSVTVQTRTVHTRTVVKKGPGGKGVSVKKNTVTKSTRVDKKPGKKMEKTTSRTTKTKVKTEKGTKTKTTRTTRKKK